jgi:hypothetical protein
MLGYSARVRVGAVGLFALGATLLAVAACQLIAGTETRTLNPEHGGCSLPSGTGPQVRIANFVPDTSVVDVCIRPAGGSWGEPLILNGGTGCPAQFGQSAPPDYSGPPGFAYTQVSIPFTAPAETVDVKMVTAGDSCEASALTEADHVKLAPAGQAVTTLLRIGGADGIAQKIEALPENYPTNLTNTYLRLVHAMPGVGPIDFGLAQPTATQLPTTLAQVQVPNIPFGQTAAPGAMSLASTPVTSAGYIPIIAGMFPIAVGVHGSGNPEKAIIFLSLMNLNGAEYSFYAAGLNRNNAYPEQGYFCNENPGAPTMPNNGLLVQCQKTKLSGLSVDVFTASLYGPNAPAYSQRKTAITDPNNSPIQKRDSDIMCLSEVDFVGDIQQIIANSLPPDAGGTGSFPYSYWVQTNVTTPFTNPTDQEGGVPPAPTTAPCANVINDNPSLVSDTYNCMIQHCSSNGTATGQLPGTTDCLSQNCSQYLGQLLLSAPYQGCFNCIVDYAASDQPYSAGQTACTMTVQQPFGFNGQLSNLILSRYPLTDTKYYIFPSTNYRQGALKATVVLEDQSVDFYCTFLTSTLIASEQPYTGNYGNGGSPSSEVSGGAYANEQLLQAQDLISWVQQTSGNMPAIIVGDWRSSLAGPADAGPSNPEAGIFTSPAALIPETQNLLAMAFQPATAPGWVPTCTYCPQTDNVLNVGQTSAYFMNQPYLYKWGTMPASAAQVESLLYTQPTMAVTFGDAGTFAPISQYFGLNIQVVRPK